MKRRSKNQKQQPTQRPSILTENFIEIITLNPGNHKGTFQIDQIISKKAERFWIVYISDGYYKLKISFSGQSGKDIDEKRIVKGSIIQATIITYIEKNVFNIKQIQTNWGVAYQVGDPNKWQLKRVNTNLNGNRQIKWIQQIPVNALDYQSSLEESSSAKKQEKTKKSRGTKKSNKSKNQKNKSKEKIKQKSKKKDKYQQSNQIIEQVLIIKNKTKQSKPKSKKQVQKHIGNQSEIQQKSNKRIKKQFKSKLKTKVQKQESPRYNLRSKSRNKQISIKKQQSPSKYYQQQQHIIKQIHSSLKKKSKKSTIKSIKKPQAPPKQYISQFDSSFDNLNQFTLTSPLVAQKIKSMESLNKIELEKLSIQENQMVMINYSSSKKTHLLVSEQKPSSNKLLSSDKVNFSMCQQSNKNNQIDENDILQLIKLQKQKQHQQILRGTKFHQIVSSTKKQFQTQEEIINELNIFQTTNKRKLETNTEKKRQQQELEEIQKILLSQFKQIINVEIDTTIVDDQLLMLQQFLEEQEKQKKRFEEQTSRSKKSKQKSVKIQNTKKQIKTVVEKLQIPQFFIENINPMMGSNWTIFLKLISLSTLTSSGKNSKYYAIFIDKTGNFMQAQIPIKHPAISILQQQSFYQISKGQINTPQFYKLKGISQTIAFSTKTNCTKSSRFDYDEQHSFSLVYSTLKQVQTDVKNSDLLINVIAIVCNIQKGEYLKNGQSKSKTIFSLIDPITSTQFKVSDFIGNIVLQQQKVVSIFNLKTNFYKGSFQLTTTNNTIITKGKLPNNLLVDQLETMCNDEVIMRFVAKNNFELITIEALQNMQVQVQKGSLQASDLKGAIIGKIQSYQRYKLYYLSCPTCKKKLLQRIPNVFSCGKCKQTKNPSARYLITADIYTSHGKLHVMFDERLSNKIMNIRASDLYQIAKKGQSQRFQQFQRNMQQLIGKQILVQVQSSGMNLVNKFNYSLKYLQLIESTQSNKDILNIINNYKTYL